MYAYTAPFGGRGHTVEFLFLRGVSMLHEALGGYWDSMMIYPGSQSPFKKKCPLEVLIRNPY